MSRSKSASALIRWLKVHDLILASLAPEAAGGFKLGSPERVPSPQSRDSDVGDSAGRMAAGDSLPYGACPSAFGAGIERLRRRSRQAEGESEAPP